MDKIIQDSKEAEERLTRSLKSKDAEIEALRSEINRLNDEKITELETLESENVALKAKLRDTSDNFSPSMNMEKEQIKHDLALNDLSCQDMEGVDGTCSTPDWDKHSCSSLSEVSVACLQDRIMQMEETHHSTNEELQATLQELADLQTQLMDLQSENERLTEEKNVLLESLCRQTEKLEDSRIKVDTLQELLLKGKDGDTCTEREQKLVDLLKSAQDERETLLLKQEDLNNQLTELRNAADSGGQEANRLSERVKLLEFTVEASNAEKKQLEQKFSVAKQESNLRVIEISRLNTLLDNAKAKISELEQARELGDKSEVDKVIDNARKEKDFLEAQVANLQEQLSRSICEVEKLKEQFRQLQEECKVTRNNAKSVVGNLEYQLEQLRDEKLSLVQKLQDSRELAAELQVQAQCHLEDKLQLKSVLSETQKHLVLNEKKMSELERILNEEKRIKIEKNEEWEQFQSDLLMTVRVANDLKTEAQTQSELLIAENKELKERITNLEAQIDKLKVKIPSPTPTTLTDTSASVLNSVQQDLANRRTKQGISRQDSRLSVKSLIESIENATKQAKAGPGSRSSSTSSLSSITSDVRCTVPTITSSISTGTQGRYYSDSEIVKTSQANNKTPNNQNSNSRNIILTDCQQYKTEITPVSILSNKSVDYTRRNSYSDIGERKDPLSALVRNGGSKRNALLKWCQNKMLGYRNIDITNFSSSWNDGLGFCALLHTYLPDKVPYDTLIPNEKKRNFTIAFEAAESVGIQTSLNITDMVQLERPDWQQIMGYITAIYKHFET
ncbi:hypothetical protein RUM43_010096 [Polyplax serrata]|uniref:Calponin-homology (CH) domain-containing protein n=1 Tax=Polyplax serrata TaxID=468196 RepID=A0AAN8PKW6_POLSC